MGFKKLFLSGVVATFFLIGFTHEASAQLGVQSGVLIPVGDWDKFWGAGFGGRIHYKKEISGKIKLGASFGYFVARNKEIVASSGGFVSTGNAKIVPLVASLDYELNDLLYVGFDVGYTLISNELDIFLFSMADEANIPDNTIALIPKVGIKLNRFHLESRYSIIGNQFASILIGFSLTQ